MIDTTPPSPPYTIVADKPPKPNAYEFSLPDGYELEPLPNYKPQQRIRANINRKEYRRIRNGYSKAFLKIVKPSLKK